MQIEIIIHTVGRKIGGACSPSGGRKVPRGPNASAMRGCGRSSFRVVAKLYVYYMLNCLHYPPRSMGCSCGLTFDDVYAGNRGDSGLDP